MQKVCKGSTTIADSGRCSNVVKECKFRDAQREGNKERRTPTEKKKTAMVARTSPQLYLTSCFATYSTHSMIYQIKFHRDASRVSSVSQVKFGSDVAMSPHLLPSSLPARQSTRQSLANKVLRTTAADP